MKSHDLEIAISTCDRFPQYIHDTLDSMAQATASRCGSVRLCVCGTDQDYLGQAADDVDVVDTISADVWQRDFAAADTKRRITKNFMRVLEGDGPLIALQDDLEFAPRWLERAAEIAQTLQTRHRAFVLSLYAPYCFRRQPVDSYPPERFYGNQALLLSAGTRRDLLSFMRLQPELGPDDMMVKAYLSQREVPLFVANPSLVQHTGIFSAVEQRFHTSPTFEQSAK